jgi:hypothetical protein
MKVAADTVQTLIDDLRSDGHEEFAWRLEALRERQMENFVKYKDATQRAIDTLLFVTLLVDGR